MFIEIEGIDGVGKTTQCKLLKSWFEAKGEKAVVVKDLESTKLGRRIRSVLVAKTRRSKETELFGFLCCKSHLFATRIRKAIHSGVHVICDRGTGSFISYFSILGFQKQFLEKSLAVVVPSDITPVTILIDLEVMEALQRNRQKKRQSKFDSMGAQFFSKQRCMYRKLARSKKWNVIQGGGEKNDVHEQIIAVLEREANKGYPSG